MDSELDEFYLDEEAKAEIRAHAEPTLERATLWLKTFDERGRQVGLPHPLYMRRYGKERWFIEEASWPL